LQKHEQVQETRRIPAAARTRCRLGLAILFFGLYLASSSGTFLGNPDTVFMWGVARQLANVGDSGGIGDISVAPETLVIQPGNFDHLKGKDGRYYFPKGMSYSLAMAPFCWLGDALAAAHGVPQDPVLRAPYGMFGASFAGPLFATLEVLLLFELCLTAGLGLHRSLLAALGIGLGTLLWANSKSGFSEPFMGLLITFQLFCLLRFVRDPRPRWAVLAATAYGLVFLSQPAMVVLLGPPLAGLFLWTAWRTHRLGAAALLRLAAAFCLPALAFAAMFGWLNFLRYGDPASTGYWRFVQRYIPLWEGAYGVLLSPGKSLFLYSPPLLLVGAGARAWIRRFGAAALFPLLTFALFLGLYGLLPTWHGDGAWGPRYFSPLTGSLAALAAGVLMPVSPAADRQRKRWWIGLAALGALVQVIGVTTNTSAYFGLLVGNGVIGGDPSTPAWEPVLYEPQLSPVAGRARLLISRMSATALGHGMAWTLPSADGTSAPVRLEGYHILDLWPVRARHALGDSILPTVVTAWLVVIALAAAGAIVARSGLRLAGSEPLLEGDPGNALHVGGEEGEGELDAHEDGQRG